MALHKESRKMSAFLNSVKLSLEAHTAGVREKVEWCAFFRRYRLPRSVAKKSGWAMDNRDLEAIFDVARRYQGKGHVRIVELGSGTSTLILASVFPTLLEDPQIISVEGEETYARHAQEMLRQHKLDRYANVSWVPYALSDGRVWFSKPELEQMLCEKRVDILIVDAPPGSRQPRARQPAIPFFLPFLDEGSVVMLHDALRPDESRIAKEWKRFFRVCYQIATPRGFAVFEQPCQ
jgi:predicted O-methyltransferase YrrM